MLKKFSKVHIFVLVLLVSALVVSGCENGGVGNGNGDDIGVNYYSIYGTIAVDGSDYTYEPIEGAEVSVFSDGNVIERTETNSDGKYSIEDIPEGEYDIEVSFEFDEEDYNDLSKVLINSDLAGLDFVFDRESREIETDSLTKAKNFVEDLGDNTAKIADIGVKQTKHLEKSMTEIVAPFSMEVFERIGEVAGHIERFQEDLKGEDNLSGEFESDSNSEFESDSTVIWEYKVENNGLVEIEMTNLNNIMQEDENGESELIIDLSKILFKYTYTIDGNVVWDFDFKLSGDSDEIIEYKIDPGLFESDELTDETTEVQEEKDEDFERIIVKMPADPVIELNGNMEEDMTFTENNDQTSNFSSLTLNVILQSTDKGYVISNGQGSDDMITGKLNVNKSEETITLNSDVTVYSEGLSDVHLAPGEDVSIEMIRYDSNTEFEIENVLSISGEFEIEFTQQKFEVVFEDGEESNYNLPVPEMIRFTGVYDDHDSFKFKGSLGIEADYDDIKDVIRIENGADDLDEIDYIPFEIDLNGEIIEGDQIFNLEIVVKLDEDISEDEKVEDNIVVSHLLYEYAPGQFIKGDGYYSKGIFKADLVNHYGHQIIINTDSDNDEIGKLLDVDGNSLANISDGDEITFEFNDETIIALVPAPEPRDN